MQVTTNFMMETFGNNTLVLPAIGNTDVFPHLHLEQGPNDQLSKLAQLWAPIFKRNAVASRHAAFLNRVNMTSSNIPLAVIPPNIEAVLSSADSKKVDKEAEEVFRSIQSSFLKGGYYYQQISPNLRVIVVNTLYWSRFNKYGGACGAEPMPNEPPTKYWQFTEDDLIHHAEQAGILHKPHPRPLSDQNSDDTDGSEDDGDDDDQEEEEEEEEGTAQPQNGAAFIQTSSTSTARTSSPPAAAHTSATADSAAAATNTPTPQAPAQKQTKQTPAPAKPTPGMLQFNWLEHVLLDSQRRQMHVYIAGHMPPGLQYHSSCFYEYRNLTERFVDTIKGHFYGYQHSDDFFLLRGPTNNSVVGVVNLAPPIYPVYNPGIRVYEYDSTNSRAMAYTQFYLDIDLTNAMAKRKAGFDTNIEAAVAADKAEAKAQREADTKKRLKKLASDNEQLLSNMLKTLMGRKHLNSTQMAARLNSTGQADGGPPRPHVDLRTGQSETTPAGNVSMVVNLGSDFNIPDELEQHHTRVKHIAALHKNNSGQAAAPVTSTTAVVPQRSANGAPIAAGTSVSGMLPDKNVVAEGSPVSTPTDLRASVPKFMKEYSTREAYFMHDLSTYSWMIFSQRLVRDPMLARLFAQFRTVSLREWGYDPQHQYTPPEAPPRPPQLKTANADQVLANSTRGKSKSLLHPIRLSYQSSASSDNAATAAAGSSGGSTDGASSNDLPPYLVPYFVSLVNETGFGTDAPSRTRITPQIAAKVLATLNATLSAAEAQSANTNARGASKNAQAALSGLFQDGLRHMRLRR
jgi:hypothetical protein